MEPYPCDKLEGWMRDAGFINIKSELLPIPVGPWPKDKNMASYRRPKEAVADTPQKEIGTYDLTQFLEGLEGFSLRVFCNVHNWTVDEVRVFIAAVRKDFLNFKLQIQHD